jgi:hypothetical protein
MKDAALSDHRGVVFFAEVLAQASLHEIERLASLIKRACGYLQPELAEAVGGSAEG